MISMLDHAIFLLMMPYLCEAVSSSCYDGKPVPHEIQCEEKMRVTPISLISKFKTAWRATGPSVTVAI